VRRPNAVLKATTSETGCPGFAGGNVTPLAFAQGLLGRGIEIVLRGNRLWIWPREAFPHLTEAEHSYLREHRDDLKEIARSKALPETTVVWTKPTAPTPSPESRSHVADAPAAIPPSPGSNSLADWQAREARVAQANAQTPQYPSSPFTIHNDRPIPADAPHVADSLTTDSRSTIDHNATIYRLFHTGDADVPVH
jgi:hypothetical protein